MSHNQSFRRLAALFSLLIAQVTALPALPAYSSVDDVFARQRIDVWRDGRESLTFVDSPGNVAGVSDRQTPTSAASVAAAADTRVFFRSFRDGDWNIYSADGAFANQKRIQNETSAETWPRARLGGGNVLFVSNRSGSSQLYRQNHDGSELLQVTTSGTYGWPEWSPDGRRIAFAADAGGAYHIYTSNSDGTLVSCLTCQDALDHIAPTWSPDGKSIAWIKVLRSTGQAVIMVGNIDGSGARIVADNLYVSSVVRWSPDGVHLAFDYAVAANEWNKVALVNVQTGAVRTVYDARQAFVDATMGAWSPDGQSIYFTRWNYAVQNNELVVTGSYIERISQAGGVPERLTSSGRDASPDVRIVDATPPQSAVQAPSMSQNAVSVIRLRGADRESGIDHFEIQTRTSPSVAWMPYAKLYAGDEIQMNGAPGNLLYIRARAHDYAGNTEPWPDGDAADAVTRLYGQSLDFRVTDNRGWPIPAPLITVSAPLLEGVPLGASDEQTLFVSTPTSFTLALGKAGFGVTSPHQVLNAVNRARLRHIAPPSLSRLDDGGFESGVVAPAWSAARVAIVRRDAKHTGDFGATLGAPYAARQTSFTDETTRIWWQSPLINDLRGGHGMFVTDVGSVVNYWYRSPSNPAVFSRFDTGLRNQSGFGFAQTAAGFHIFWVAGAVPGTNGADAGATDYCFMSINTMRCGAPQRVIEPPPKSGVFHNLTGTAHVFLNETGGLSVVSVVVELGSNSTPVRTRVLMRKQTAAGIWEAPQIARQVDFEPPYLNHALTMDRAGGLHIVYQHERRYWYLRHAPGNGWSAPRAVAEVHSGSLILETTADGALHLLIPTPNGFQYLVRNRDGAWVERATGAFSIYDAEVDNSGRLHVLSFNDSKLLYSVLTPDGQWQDQGAFPLVEPRLARYSMLNAAGSLIVLSNFSSNGFTLHEPVSAADDTNALAAQISIPVSMTRPTLSFFHRNVLSNGASRLRTTVTAATGATVFESAPYADGSWTPASYPLDAWAGQSVTLTFESIRNGSATPADLDEITLGEWRTPVAQEVQPARLPAGYAETSLTISGSNYVSATTIAVIGATAIITPAVIAVGSDSTLTVTLPAGLPFGVYDIVLTNPDGVQSIRYGALQIGQRTWLGIVSR
jgi:Tol biopolymer transport system component